MSESDYQYYGAGWKQFRSDILESYDSQCLLCESGDELEVHHIKPIKTFEEPEDANFFDNVVPLCKRCHTRVEHIQNPNTRRTVEHFVDELKDKGLPDLGRVIDSITHKELKTNEMDPCPECYYPRRGTEPFCLDCGYKWFHQDHGWDKQPTKMWLCSKCNQARRLKEHETINSHGCLPDGGGHHFWKQVDRVVWKCSNCERVDHISVLNDYPSPHGCTENDNEVHDWKRVPGPDE